MANDGGKVAVIEQAMVDAAAVLQNNGKQLFKTCDIWKHQISADAGGMEAFERYAPFFFAKYEPPAGAREGDYDLNQKLRFVVAIGFKSKQKGVARVGNSNNTGASKARDIIISTFDDWHPGGDVGCDQLYYFDEFELVDAPKHYALQINFVANLLTL